MLIALLFFHNAHFVKIAPRKRKYGSFSSFRLCRGWWNSDRPRQGRKESGIWVRWRCSVLVVILVSLQ